MKRLFLRKVSVLILLAAVIAAGIAPRASGAYPPDNAAVLYYKTCLIYQAPGGEIETELEDVIAGKGKASAKLVEFVRGQDYTVETVLTASQIDGCDWGHDYSKGFDMQLPALSDMRKVAKIVLADAMILAQKGNTAGAIDNCIAMYRMAQHVKDRVLIDNLVGISIEKATTKVVVNILSDGKVKVGTLDKLKDALVEIATGTPGLLACMQSEIDAVTKHSSPKQVAQMVIEMGDKDGKLSDYDKDLPEKGIAYYKDHMGRMLTAMQLPYKRAIPEIQKLVKKINADAKDKPEAMLASAVVPGIESILSTDVKAKTDINALRAAVEIYLRKAATGKLPQKLPAGMGRDMFSGKDFEYSVTKSGFVLKCREKNLKSDKVEEYEFGIAE